MLKRESLEFLLALEKNNTKDWFDANNSWYQEAKRNMEEIASSLIDKLGKVHPEIINLKPKDCLFRIHRDVRFSKNKLPYKTNFGMAICEGGRKSGKAGYYLHIEPGRSFIAGGCWQPAPEQLKNIRQEIDYNGQGFKKIIEAKSFKEYFSDLSMEDALLRAPKGYDEENPLIRYIKLKSFVATSSLTDKDLLDSKSSKIIERRMSALHGLINFLNQAIT